MSDIPTEMRAVVVRGPGSAAVESGVPVIKPGADEVLVKIEYAASNPTDWKHLDSLSPAGSILGCDFSGVVVEVGTGSKPVLKVGDKVAGNVHGGKFETTGSYAEYVKVESSMVIKIPDGLDLAEASTFGIGYYTAALCLFQHQGNGFPPAKRSGNDWFFIQGGSSSVGLFAIQLAKVAGYSVVTSCSPHSFDLCKAYGADHVVDYHDVSKAVEEIKKVSNDNVVGALECIGGEDSTKLAVLSFGGKGGLLTTLLPAPEGSDKIRADVKVDRILLYTIFGYSFEFLPGMIIPASPEDREWAEKWNAASPEIITKYSIKGNPVDVRQGLDAILPGLQELKKGVSGKKLVYKIA